jgi:signal transduction histidine kinase
MDERMTKGVDHRAFAELPEPQLQRMIVVGALVSCAAWWLFSINAWVNDLRGTAWIMLAAGGVAASSALTTRRFGSGLGGTHFVFALVLGLTTVSASRGGVDPSVTPWLAIAPLVSMLGGRPRKAMMWGIVAVIAIIGLLVAQRTNLLPPTSPPTRYGGAASSIALVVTVLMMGAWFFRLRAATAAREAELQHELFEAQKLDGLGRLAGAIAHDFNNVLAVVGSHAELAASDVSTDEERAEDLAAIAAATRRGRQLTQELLSLASTSDPRNSESLQPVEVVQQLARLLERVLPKNTAIVVHAAPGVPSVLQSPRRLQQVLLNLCLAARESMSAKGTLRLTVDAFRGKPKGVPAHCRDTRWARISVIDDGPARAPRGDVEKSLGIGLSAAQRIVTDGGGFLDLAPAHAGATRYDVYLPALPEAQDAPALVHH